MHKLEEKRLLQIVVYKGLGYFKHEEPMINALEKLGYIKVDRERSYTTATKSGLEYVNKYLL